MITYVGLDPGTHTGVCIAGKVGNAVNWKFNLQELQPTHHKELYDLLNRYKPGAVICESFTYQRRDHVILDSVQYIGIARLWCEQTNKPLRMQPPSAAKNLWTQDKLVRIGLWQPNRPHAMDALRHFLYFATVTLADQQFVRQLRPSSP